MKSALRTGCVVSFSSFVSGVGLISIGSGLLFFISEAGGVGVLDSTAGGTFFSGSELLFLLTAVFSSGLFELGLEGLGKLSEFVSGFPTGPELCELSVGHIEGCCITGLDEILLLGLEHCLDTELLGLDNFFTSSDIFFGGSDSPVTVSEDIFGLFESLSLLSYGLVFGLELLDLERLLEAFLSDSNFFNRREIFLSRGELLLTSGNGLDGLSEFLELFRYFRLVIELYFLL